MQLDEMRLRVPWLAVRQDGQKVVVESTLVLGLGDSHGNARDLGRLMMLRVLENVVLVDHAGSPVLYMSL